LGTAPYISRKKICSIETIGQGSHLRGYERCQFIQGLGLDKVPDALEYAHKLGILHREIKPSNLLLDTRGTVWVTDFGLAKATDQPNLTHNGDILGTLRYLPPEPFEGQSDVRVEVYSLGPDALRAVGVPTGVWRERAGPAAGPGDDLCDTASRSQAPRSSPLKFAERSALGATKASG
jgi:serine/threonine protein kinase